MRATSGLGALTEREKQTLRLIVRGHDAKSIAVCLGLSVHTVNERLRDARRKLAVPSSRAAARLLLEVEDAMPQTVGDTILRDDRQGRALDKAAAPDGVGGAERRPARIMLIGGIAMSLILGLLALAAVPQAPTIAPAAPAVRDASVVAAAERWLGLLDQGRWEESYRATGAAFRALNTVEAWTAASNRARAPLGAMIARTVLSQETLPAPPDGYEVVKFRTRFANRAEAVETVTLDRAEGGWRVVGITVG